MKNKHDKLITNKSISQPKHKHILTKKTSFFIRKKKMTTPMPFFKELAAAAGSSLVRDMMVERFEREVSVTLVDEGELRKKAKEIMSRVAERDFVLGELGMVFAFESSVQSISELTNLQTQDLTEVSMILVNVMKKQKRATELLLFIDRLKAMPY